jgi:RHS repeat-associated protein
MHLAIESNSTSVANEKGRLTGRTDSSGSYTFYYDAQGNVTKEEKTISNILYTTEYGYSKDNVLTSITYPSGRVLEYTLDVTGRTTQVDTTLNGNPKTLASSITYLPYGGITGLTYGNTLSLTHDYDNQYRTSEIAVGSILDRTYGYDANGNITSTDDGEAAGNEALESAGIYSYGQGTNLLADIQAGSPVVYDYDENGNTVTANNRTFTYDLSNRLITVQEGSTTLGQYVYNALNQRIKRTVQGVTTIFHYDLQGHLIAETNAGGQTLVEYFYLGDQPLAMVRPSEALYYFHNDHLGTPQILTNGTGNVIWKAVYTPFGEAEITTGTVENPIRFPGQYYDQETGLHYNYYRYYDPKMGRYLTPDPIELDGGSNLYVYVENTPTNQIDLLGLKCVKQCMLVTAYCATGPGADWPYYKPKKKGEKPTGVGPGTIAVADTNPPPYSFGSCVTVSSSNGAKDYQGTIHDTGKGWDREHHNVPPEKWIDIWLASCKEAKQWGKQWREVEICDADDCKCK